MISLLKNKLNISKLLAIAGMTMVMFSACQQKKQSDSQAQSFPTEKQLAVEQGQTHDAEALSDMRQPDVKVHVRRGQPLAMQTEGLTLTAVDAAVQHEADYSVTSLVEEELPPLPQGMMNMTASSAGYRLLPGGEHFSPYAELRVAYDPERLPTGYTAEDIYTSYYDTTTWAWVRLERLEVDTIHHEIVSATTHFTDFINELLKSPEMPETQAFVPTAISGLEAANPLAAYTIVSAPEANNMGTANISYPFRVPEGRQGMQPQIALTYNSNGGNGVCGMGWDLPVPCISVETRWGVPLYDNLKETETYLLNGEQLLTSYDQLPAFARNYDNRMSGDVRFYPRVEGAFDSIIRHGSGPDNYWWEVFTRNGLQYVYGNTNESRLCSQKAKGIAKWYLAKVIDGYGNTIQYKYNTYRKGHGGYNSGTRVYLDRILYTMPDEGKVDSSWYGYCVSFYYGEGRKDPVINGNYGVKENTCLLLDSVKTWYIRQSQTNGLTLDSIAALAGSVNDQDFISIYKKYLNGSISEPELYHLAGQYLGIPSSLQQTDSCLIRGYRLLYSYSSTGKSLLDAAIEMSPSEWSQYAANVSTNDFNSYDCILKYHRFNYQDVDQTTFSEPDTLVTDIADGNSGLPFMNASPLGGGSDWHSGVNLSAGIGLGFESWFRTANLEATANITPYAVNNGKSILIDLNGDGYPDLLFPSGVFNNHWKYQLFNPRVNRYDSSHSFDLPTDGFSRSTSDGFALGLALHAGVELDSSSVSGGVNLGAQKTKNSSKTKMYFSDVNADGFPDIVKNGQVWFNNSYGNNISFGDSYQVHTQDDVPCDVSYYSLEDASILDYSIFEPGNVSQTFQSNINDMPYDKDSLYVRSTVTFDTLPAKQNDTVRRSAVRVWIAPYEGTISISGYAALDDVFDVARTNTGTDGVYVSIQHNDSVLVGYDMTNSTPQNMTISSLPVKLNDRIYFRVESLLDDKYDVVYWNPVITYTNATPNTVDSEGRNIYIFDAARDFLPWQDERFYMPHRGRVDINANYTFKSAMSDTVFLSIICVDSTGTTEYIHKTDTILPGATPTNAPLSFINTLIDDKASIRFEAYSRSGVDWTKLKWFPHIISRSFVDPTIPASSIVYDEDMNETTVYSIDRYPSPIFPQEAYSLPDFMDLAVFKSLYRGWGAFAYNDSTMRTPIVESRLNLDARYDSAYVNDLIDSPESMTGDTNNAIVPDVLQTGIAESIPNPDNTTVSVMNVEYDPENQSRIWTSFAYRAFITADKTSVFNWQTTRTTLSHDELLYPTTNQSISASGMTAVGPIKEATQNGWGVHVSLSAGIDVNGDTNFINISPSVCFNSSHGTHELTSDFMDFNGDGFPDVISENTVQYSRSMGGLSDLKTGIVLGGERGIQKTIYDAYSLQGGAAFAVYHKIFKNPADVKIHERKRGVNVNSNVNFSASSSDHLELSWMDMNGDGLPDCVNGANVGINLGYDYYDMESMSSNPMPQNKSTNRLVNPSAGYSFSNARETSLANTTHNTVNNSFSAGLSTNESNNESVVLYADINGDGLVDKIIDRQIDSQYVYFNRGWGFCDNSYTLSASTKNQSCNYNLDLDGNYTYGCPITVFLGVTLKFQISGGLAIGNSVSTTEATLMDMNADGLPDLVMRGGNNKDKIIVRYNQLFSVDKLVSVDAFYGNHIEIGYAQASYSPGSRQRPTIMQTLSVSDATGESVDVRQFVFLYSNYVHSVGERTSFGFSNVTVMQLSNNQAYRIIRQKYRTDIYKMRGLKYNERIEDAQGHGYVEHNWEYELKQISDGRIVPVNMQHCFAATWPALNIASVRYFDPSNNDIKIETVEQYNHGGYGLVQQYINRNNTQTTDDDLICNVKYTRCNRNQTAMPTDMYVYDRANNLLQRRRAKYNPNGSLGSLALFNNTSVSVTEYYYDQYGNVTHVVLPENNEGEHPEYKYDYDNLVHQFRISATDVIWGDESRTDYDIRQGVPLRVFSVSGDSISYTYDDWGRPLSIRAPMEADTTNYPTVRYAYWDGSVPALQLTNPRFPSFVGRPAIVGMLPPVSFILCTKPPIWAQTINKSRCDANFQASTVLFVDGHARVLQTRKTSVVNGVQTQVASGHTVYDNMGRVVEQYEPFVTNNSFCQYAAPTDTGMVTRSVYDILDRVVEVSIPSESILTTNTYGFESLNGATHFMTETIDPENKRTVKVTDVRNLILKNTDANGGITRFTYYANGLLHKSFDPEGFPVEYQYDMLGQLKFRIHPDAGMTEFIYDPAGHLVQENNPLGQISYKFKYQRPIYKRYSYMSGNDVTYEYGTSGRERGRLAHVMDGTGERWLYYDALGNVAKEIRTVSIPGDYQVYTFGSTYDYDSWGRMICMTYPDGEKVNYHYNAAGDLNSMDWVKGHEADVYIEKIRYNKYGNRIFIKYGNGTSANYYYDQLQRLNRLKSYDHNNVLMQDLVYDLDKVGNILHLDNNASPISSLGGLYRNTYKYDNIYRLTDAYGSGVCGSWDNFMEYTASGRIGWKYENTNSAISIGTTELNYGYCDTYQPHAPRRIKDSKNKFLFDLQWDEAGNLGQRNLAKGDGYWLGSRYLFWTEDNRMHAAIDEKFYSYYTYDYTGERTLKLIGRNNEMDVNAQIQHTSAMLDNPTLYPSPYVVIGLHGYTKHYYAGTERVCAKIGGGFGSRIADHSTQSQYWADRLFAQSCDNIHSRRLPKTDVNCIESYGHVSNDELNVRLVEMPRHLYADARIDPEGFHHVVERCEHECVDEDLVYFYHSDHLGSASWITNKTGNAIQHLQYMPFGAPFVNQHAPGAGYQERFTFTGKERDEETGFGYFGARYMDHELMTMWLSVDPLADKYPSISPYAYCAWNPIRLIDPDGREIGDYYDTQGNYLGWDGKQDMNVYIVKEQGSINKISSNTRNKKTTSSSDVNIAVSTNYAVMRKAVEVLDMTHERNGQKEFGVSMKGITPSSIQEGTYSSCTIYPVDDGFSGEGVSIHSHPDADERSGHWITHPSQVDIDETFCNYNLNIIVGQCEKRDLGQEIHNTKYNVQYGAAFYGRPLAGTPKEDVKPKVVILENALRNIAYGAISAACSRIKVE